MRTQSKKTARSTWRWIALGLGCSFLCLCCIFVGLLFVVNHFVFWSREATLADYAEIRAEMGAYMAHFPASVPPDAADVSLHAEGFFQAFPALDPSVHLRFTLPLAAAKELEASVKPLAYRSDSEHSPGFTTYYLPVESQTHQRSVTINPTTGEVSFYVMR